LAESSPVKSLGKLPKKFSVKKERLERPGVDIERSMRVKRRYEINGCH
jgi:hypothetical protein